MLRTNCGGHECLPVCLHAKHLLRTQNLCPGHKNVSPFARPREHVSFFSFFFFGHASLSFSLVYVSKSFDCSFNFNEGTKGFECHHNAVPKTPINNRISIDTSFVPAESMTLSANSILAIRILFFLKKKKISIFRKLECPIECEVVLV